MEKPKKLTGEQGAYIEYLEEKLKVFSSKQTKVQTFLTFKKIVDDTNKLVWEGVSYTDPETQETTKIELISEASLMSGDEKAFDRLSKFLDKAPSYLEAMDKFEEQLTPEDIDLEKKKLKGEYSVEGRVF